MAADGIQRTTIGWQVRKLSQNISEWIELRLSGNEPVEESSPFELPPWLSDLLLWLSIAVGVIIVSWFLWRLLVYYLDSRSGPSQKPVPLASDPKPTALSVAEWLRQAKRWEQDGNWPAACRALYMAALQILHDRSWVPHASSRTDGEYLSTLHQVSRPRPYQLLIRTHERAEFGGVLPTAENFKRCQHAYREIEKK